MDTRRRGEFIVLEGIDGVGKSTQALRLYDYYAALAPCVSQLPLHIAFPKRDTPVGGLINRFLSNAYDTPEAGRVLHLLFSANRWEQKGIIEEALAQGRTVICDRYVLSGVAYSAALGVPVSWSATCDTGLPVPDYVVYLQTDDVRSTLERRNGSSLERYEVLDFQRRAAEEYNKIFCSPLRENCASKQIVFIDAGLPEDQVFQKIVSVLSLYDK